MQLTYADVFRPTGSRAAFGYDVLLVAGGSVFISLMAQVAFYLPGLLVPFTGQTFAVLLIGMLLGARRGAGAVVAYLLEGAAGLPVFAAGQFGLPYMLGPTGGYLLAFVGAAWVVGYLASRGWGRRIWTAGAAMALGNLVIYAGGMGWLSRFIGVRAAFHTGVWPFLIGDLIKLIAAALLLPVGWRILRRTGAGRGQVR